MEIFLTACEMQFAFVNETEMRGTPPPSCLYVVHETAVSSRLLSSA